MPVGLGREEGAQQEIDREDPPCDNVRLDAHGQPFLARLPVLYPRQHLPPVVHDDSGPLSKEPRVVGFHASDAVTAFRDHAMEERALPPRPEESIAKQYRGVVRGPEACPTHRGRRIVV